MPWLPHPVIHSVVVAPKGDLYFMLVLDVTGHIEVEGSLLKYIIFKICSTDSIAI